MCVRAFVGVLFVCVSFGLILLIQTRRTENIQKKTHKKKQKKLKKNQKKYKKRKKKLQTKT